MRNLKCLKLTFLGLFCLICCNLFAQTPVGANIANPVILGTLAAGSAYTDTKNNSRANGYLNDIGQPSDDIYYQFTLANATTVSASTCGSPIDTYMYILDANGNILASDDDNGPLCSGLQASIQKQLSAGTYYVVSEGWNTTAGNITTSISIPADTLGDTPDAFSIRIKSIFQHVDLTQVNTGILLDLGVDFINVDQFSGTTLIDSNYTTLYAWRLLYASLASSQANSQVSFTPIANINQTVNSYIGGSLPIPLMLLNYNYQSLRPDAVTANLMYDSNDQLYD